MHATHLLNNYLEKQCQGIHKKRMESLMVMVKACIAGKKLSVTGLGRHIQNETYTKHNIKRADRLIGNPCLNQERPLLYRALSSYVIGRQKHPVILIDWSNLSADGHYHLLRAALPVGGRGLTFYEVSYPRSQVGNPKVHMRFLKTLKQLLPGHCRPIIITDAGFFGPWFRAVQSLGWDFIGRVRGRRLISPQGKNQWKRVEPLFETATVRPQYLGFIDLSRNQPLPCHAYLVKKKKQGRIKKTVFGQPSHIAHSKKNASRERTPWLIVTSLEGGDSITNRVMNHYRTRMQIEESFRDVKNSRWGFSLREAKATSTYRYENLLLVGTLATFAVWLVGKIAEQKNIHRQYQANSIKNRNVISTFYLGCQVIKKYWSPFSLADYQCAFTALQQQYNIQCQT